MSLEEEDFWNTSSVKAFNFDDEENQQPRDNIKTLGSVLAAKTPSNEPFLKPSIMMYPGRDKIELLVEHLDKDCINSGNNQKTKQDPKVYVGDIIYKEVPIDFSPFKSKREKLLLLDCAICCCDGNTITAATVFLSKTLKPALFIDEIRKRPIALNHYMNYLELNDNSKEALALTLAI